MNKLFAACIFAVFSSLTVAADAPQPEAFFAATLADPDDKPVALASFRGKPLVVNFWARWCPPCRAEIPELNAFRKALAGKVEVVGIGIEDDAPAVKAFVREYAMNYPVFLARKQGQPLMQALGNRRGGLPYTLFIDRHGRVVGHKLGLLRKSDLDNILPQLLAP